MIAFLKQLAAAWSDDQLTRKSAALAYYTVFSIAPLLVIVIAIVGLFVDSGEAASAIVDQARALIGQDGADLLKNLLAAMQDDHAAGLAAIVAFVVALVGATTVFAELKQSLDEIWDVEAKAPSGIWGLIRARILSFGLVLVLAFLLLVSLVVNTALTALFDWVATAIGMEGAVALGIASFLVSMLVVTGMFAAIYKLLPEVHLAWKDVAGAALLTALLFSLGRFAIGLYLGNSAPASAFGAAGSLAVMLLWVYYSALIFFLGAEITRHRLSPERRDAARRQPNPATARAQAVVPELSRPSARTRG